MIRTKLGRCLALLWLTWAVLPLAAFRLEPISQEFAPAGRESARIFRIENSGEEKIAVRVSVATREHDLDGGEQNGDASAFFQVYPAYLLIPPGAVQSVRVKYIGPSELSGERAFRIIAEQIPLNDHKEDHHQGGGIRLIFKYVGNIYVLPGGAREDVVLESVSLKRSAAGETGLVLMFYNRGGRHALLGDLRLRLSQKYPLAPELASRVELGPEQLKGIAGENLLAGQRRRFVLPAPEGFYDGEIEASFSFTPLR